MTPEQIRARLLAISNLLEGIVAAEGVYTEEQLTEIETLNTEFETLNAQLDASEKVEAMKAKATASQGRKAAPVNPAPAVRVEVGRDGKDRFGGFNNSGEFLMAVRQAAGGSVHKNLQNAASFERVGEDGGFLVPEEMSSEIVKKLESKESLLSATTNIKISGNSLTLNVDESQPWNSGVTAYWMQEGGAFTESKPSFKQASFRLNKLGALVSATDELLEDAVALESYIKTAAPEAIMHKINDAIINGNGVGKPNGVLSSGFTISIAEETSQAADTVLAGNIIKMYSRMIPSARAGASWYMNAGVESQLLGMVDANDNYIYLAPGSQMNQSPYGLLLGRPVIPMMSAMPALGDPGDILFANLKYYYSVQKAGIKSATSVHLYFDTEKTAFRFSMRIDGKCPFTSAVTTQYGAHTMSAFIKIDDRD